NPLALSNSDGSSKAADVAEPVTGPGEPQQARPRVRRSLVLSFTERYASILINLLATAILARLLTPRDYGVYTVAVVVVGIASTLRDFGVISFLIQEKNLTESQVRTAYGVS